MSKLFEELQPFLDKNMAIETTLTLLSWDNETLAPEESIEFTARQLEFLQMKPSAHLLILRFVKF